MLKSLIVSIAILSSLISCSNQENKTPAVPLSGDITKDIKSLIPDGTHNADIMDRLRQTPREEALLKKFKDSTYKNYDWFIKYMKTVPEGTPLPYHPQLGLTEEEYAELKEYFDNAEIISSGNEKISAKLINDTLLLRSQGKLEYFDSIQIDLKRNIVLFRGYELMIADTVNVLDDENGLRSKWKGYTWRYEEPENLSLDHFEDLGNLNMKQFKFTVGKLEKNGKTYISLKCTQIEDGVKTVSFELPIIF